MDFLRKGQSWLPYTDYGNRYKPFIGILFQKDDCCFVAPLSSYKEHYSKMEEFPSFIKIHDNEYDKDISCVNLSRMFPVPKNEMIEVRFKNIDLFRSFEDDKEKSHFLHFLKKQMKEIEKLDIPAKAEDIYLQKLYGEPTLESKRCFDYRRLECRCTEWILKKEHQIDARIKYEEGRFHIQTPYGIIDRDDLPINEILSDIKSITPFHEIRHKL